MRAWFGARGLKAEQVSVEIVACERVHLCVKGPFARKGSYSPPVNSATAPATFLRKPLTAQVADALPRERNWPAAKVTYGFILDCPKNWKRAP